MPCLRVTTQTHAAPFPCTCLPPLSPTCVELPVILTICSHSLVPTSWWRSSSSTASQLSRPHLYREGTYGRGQPQQVLSSLGAGARRWAAHSLMKCCVSSRLRKTRGPCVTVLTRFSSCWQSFGGMASALGKAQQQGQVRYQGLREMSGTACSSSHRGVRDGVEVREPVDSPSGRGVSTYLSARSPGSLLAPEWLSLPDRLPESEALLRLLVQEEFWELGLLSSSSQPPPACPGWCLTAERDQNGSYGPGLSTDLTLPSEGLWARRQGVMS